MSKANELNSITLAYVGDAVYELFVRHHLIKRGFIKVQQLHDYAVQFVSAPTQAAVIKQWIKQNYLTEKELAVVRRGRNAKTHSVPKNVSIEAYKYATAFEALLGYHYLRGNESRLHELIEAAITERENTLANEGV